MIQIFLIAREILDTLYRNDEKKEDHEESESEDEPAKEKKKSFPEIVDKVIKVINLGFGLGQDLNQVEEIEESDDVKEATAEGEMMEDAEQIITINPKGAGWGRFTPPPSQISSCASGIDF